MVTINNHPRHANGRHRQATQFGHADAPDGAESRSLPVADNNKNFCSADENNNGKTIHRAGLQRGHHQINMKLNIDGTPGSTIRARVAVSFTLLDSACGGYTWGETEDFSLTITENTAPVSLSIAHSLPPNRVDFDNTTSDSRIAQWHWDFGDGQTSTEKSPSHHYATDGEYWVVASAVDAKGNRLAQWLETLSFRTTTTAQFSPTVAGKQVQLNSQSVMPINTTVSWDMGDGSQLTGEQHTAYTYANDGHYTITLTLTNPNHTASATRTVTIGAAEPYLPTFSTRIEPD